MTEAPETLDLASRLLDAQAIQHADRQEATRELIDTVRDMGRTVGKRLDRVEADLADKPGKAEVRAIIAIAGAVFVLMLVSFLRSKGVDTTGAVTDTRTILAPMPGLAAPTITEP